MPLIRKRRATQAEPPNNEDDSSGSTQPQPPNRNNNSARRRRRTGNTNANDSDASGDNDGDETGGYNDDSEMQARDGMDAMVKKMIRLALASEYSRQPIRRKDISTKVLGEQGSRQFKTVFEQAQRELRYRFGMEMTEQPAKAGLGGMSQGRATQRQTQSSSSSATSNKSWTLTTTLPPAYRTDTITPPPRAPSTTTESSYVGLYTFIISLITLSGGSIPEQKLERYLRRANADNYTPVDRTELLIARLVKEGYLIKNRDTEGGDEVVEYFVGARGKVEVGDGGVEGLAREVFGFREAEGEGEGGDEAGGTEREEFEGKLRRSLGLKEMAAKKDQNGSAATAGAGGGRRGRGDASARGRNADGDNDEDMDY